MADLKTKILGINFSNPIFTAAGPTAANYEMLKRAQDGGAGGLVVKTISVEAAKVPIPNISNFNPNSLLNAELWSEVGYKEFIEQELKKIRRLGLPVIASVGYSPQDLEILGKELNGTGLIDAVEFSIHYIDKDASNLRKTAVALKNNIDVPVFAKFSPGVSDLPLAVSMLDDVVDGYVAINSVGPALDFNIETRKPFLGSSDGRGWLSGRAILPIGLHFVASIHKLSMKPIIGVGGVRAAEDVVKYLMAGASAVQVCSLSILKGQGVYGKLAKDLEKWMDAHNYPNIESLIGIFEPEQEKVQHFLYHGKQVLPTVDYDVCDNCGACVKICVHNALEIKDKLTLEKEICVRCGICTQVCPTHALEMKEE
ncbi:MAG: 4Fe-4S binding protein [Ignavibacteriales bacterium]|nr:4Fe-4S binding protein [Ignavibacteriales bacterium]